MIDFTTIDYLASGTPRQKKVYETLKALKLFENLARYNPLLAGTIPIDIDVPESDLDIICQCEDHLTFAKELSVLFGDKHNFQSNAYEKQGMPITTGTFSTAHFKIEIFAQNLPTVQQNAFRHMLIEYQILEDRGSEFKAAIKKLRAEGYKTEPAFATLLGLAGNPYEALLSLEKP